MFTAPPNALPPQTPASFVPAAAVPNTPDFSQPPQNDDELRAYLQSAAPLIKSATGKAHQQLSDTLYKGVSSYAKANPQSSIAKQALEAAHKNAPRGHKFPSA